MPEEPKDPKRDEDFKTFSEFLGSHRDILWTEAGIRMTLLGYPPEYIERWINRVDTWYTTSPTNPHRHLWIHVRLDPWNEYNTTKKET